MGNFWEQSPEWQRREELRAEFKAAQAARGAAGEVVLACVEIDAIARCGDYWRECRQEYLDAVDTYDEAFATWERADRAFKASSTGQAYSRYLADPLAYRAAEAAESEAA